MRSRPSAPAHGRAVHRTLASLAWSYAVGCSFDAAGIADGSPTSDATESSDAPADASSHPTDTQDSSADPSNGPTTAATTESSASDEGGAADSTTAPADTTTSGAQGSATSSASAASSTDTTAEEDSSSTSTTSAGGICGDGVLDDDEECDDPELGSFHCGELGDSYGGEPTCGPDCEIDAGRCCELAGTGCVPVLNDCCGSCGIGLSCT